MRAGGAVVAKPLVPIRGVPLLEWNLAALLRAGFRDLVVAVPAHTPEIGEFARARGAELARRSKPMAVCGLAVDRSGTRHCRVGR